MMIMEIFSHALVSALTALALLLFYCCRCLSRPVKHRRNPFQATENMPFLQRVTSLADRFESWSKVMLYSKLADVLRLTDVEVEWDEVAKKAVKVVGFGVW